MKRLGCCLLCGAVLLSSLKGCLLREVRVDVFSKGEVCCLQGG